MEKAHSNQNYNGNAGVGSKGVAALITVRMMQQHDILMYSFWHDSHAIMLTTILIPSTPTNQAHPTLLHSHKGLHIKLRHFIFNTFPQ